MGNPERWRRWRERARRLSGGLVDRLSGSRASEADWRRMLRVQVATLVGALLAVTAFILMVDPYDVVPFSPPATRPIMDINQRYFYPAVIRSGRYDSFVLGTSTSRLLDPKELDQTFGGRFANLAMNAATAWEQMQVARLFLRVDGAPRVMILGIDAPWCDPEAAEHRITFRGFPEWMYDDNKWNDLLYLLNGRTLEISGRLVGYWLGLRPPRMREDGYEVFVPPEAQYNPARERRHIWEDIPPRDPVVPPVVLSQAQRAALKFPALDWLEGYLGDLASRSKVIISAMPVHISAQPIIGSAEAAVERECLDRIAAIAQRHGALMVDWRIASPLTSEDSNYWDRLHYRLPIANRIIQSLAEAERTGTDAADGTYKILKASP
jgi:hypothetical protein